ncbi:MAG: hypothetical protein MZU84_05440 [Sphingobacterium sp.]|nr:hypothetical protein [Sphingobacterium sp.]
MGCDASAARRRPVCPTQLAGSADQWWLVGAGGADGGGGHLVLAVRARAGRAIAARLQSGPVGAAACNDYCAEGWAKRLALQLGPAGATDCDTRRESSDARRAAGSGCDITHGPGARFASVRSTAGGAGAGRAPADSRGRAAGATERTTGRGNGGYGTAVPDGSGPASTICRVGRGVTVGSGGLDRAVIPDADVRCREFAGIRRWDRRRTSAAGRGSHRQTTRRFGGWACRHESDRGQYPSPATQRFASPVLDSAQQAGRAQSQSRTANRRFDFKFWRGWRRTVRNPWEPPARTGFNQKR